MPSDKRILPSLIPEFSLVVDIGGGANPFPRADYVIDGLAYEERGALRHGKSQADKVTKDHWIKLDLCEHKPWPFPDKFFDYALCTHVLEDVRDPIWVCSEMMRIAKAGCIATPSRILEQSKGIEHPCYAGYYHHRWLVSEAKGKLTFRFKPHLLHVTSGAIVANVGPNEEISPKHAELTYEWRDSFGFEEILCFHEQDVIMELCAFAAKARQMSGLIIPLERPWLAKLKRWVYFSRLRWGG